MDVKKIIHQGPGKTIYVEVGPNNLFPSRVFHFFTDEYFCEKTKSTIFIPGKGALTNRLSALFFSQLKKWNVDTHFLWVRDMCTCAMRDVTPLPFSLRVYCQADEFMAKHFSLELGTAFSPLLIEYTSNQESYQSYGLNEDFLIALEWIDQEELEDLVTLALQCVHGFRGFFGAKDLQLISMDLSFGRNMDGDFCIIGHFSPETLCLQWEHNNTFWGGRYLKNNPQEHYQWFTAMFLPQEISQYDQGNQNTIESEFLWPQKPILRVVSPPSPIINDEMINCEEKLPDTQVIYNSFNQQNQQQNPLENFQNVIHLTDFLHKADMEEEEDLWF